MKQKIQPQCEWTKHSKMMYNIIIRYHKKITKHGGDILKIKDGLTFDEIAEIVDSYNADNNKSKTAVIPDEQLNNQMKIEY